MRLTTLLVVRCWVETDNTTGCEVFSQDLTPLAVRCWDETDNAPSCEVLGKDSTPLVQRCWVETDDTTNYNTSELTHRGHQGQLLTKRLHFCLNVCLDAIVPFQSVLNKCKEKQASTFYLTYDFC